MSLGTPRRMKMTYCYPAIKHSVDSFSQGLVARSLFPWCRAPVEEVFSTEYPGLCETD
jgi:hypothetical protein